MGRFSNGTEGMMYEEQLCSRCIHYGDRGDCPILAAHCNVSGSDYDPDSILHLLIPYSNGMNGDCRMFFAGDDLANRVNKLKESRGQLCFTEAP